MPKLNLKEVREQLKRPMEGEQALALRASLIIQLIARIEELEEREERIDDLLINEASDDDERIVDHIRDVIDGGKES